MVRTVGLRPDIIYNIHLHENEKQQIANGSNNSKIKYQICGKKQNRYTNTQIRDRSLCFLGTGTSMKSGGTKKFYGPKPSFVVSLSCHPSAFHL